MPAYRPYPNEKTTPNRKTRKSDRSKVFNFNRTLAAKLRKEARAAREAALEAQEETVEE